MMVAPGTPPALLSALNREFNAVLQQPEVRQRMENSGLQITGGAPEDFAAVLKRDYDKYGARVARRGSEAGMTPPRRDRAAGWKGYGALRRPGAQPQAAAGVRARLDAAVGDRRVARRHLRHAPTAPRARSACRRRRHGSILRVVEFPPERGARCRARPSCAKWVCRHQCGSRHPGCTTRSVDYAIVMEGEIDMLLDDCEVHLAAGDVLVQQGTNHAWVNRGNGPAASPSCSSTRRRFGIMRASKEKT